MAPWWITLSCGVLFFFLWSFSISLWYCISVESLQLADPSNSTPRVLVIRQVVELRSELKQCGLTVSGPKNKLIERLRSYQELKMGYGNTSSLTAGGITRSGAERGALSAPDGSRPEAPHQTPHHWASLNLWPGDGNNPVFECKIKWTLSCLPGASKYRCISLSLPLQQPFSPSHCSAARSHLWPAPPSPHRTTEPPETPALTFRRTWSESPYSCCYAWNPTHHLTDIRRLTPPLIAKQTKNKTQLAGDVWISITPQVMYAFIWIAQ